MRDREVVASIKAGDPAGLAEAYGSYAASLYAYCASMLREPADAADAVQDTFLIASSGLRGLRDPDRLRPWLYTVARNVCLRKLRNDKLAARYAPRLGPPPGPGGAGDSSPGSRGVGQVTDPSALADPARVSDRAEMAELRAFVQDAADGLTTRDREILQLRLWQELSLEDTATALGLSRGHASALFSRARAQLETSLGALLVARSGRVDCERLDTMLADWDGQLTVLLRKRLSRHIEQCDICGQRRRRELVPAFLGLSPWAAVVGAAAAEAAKHSARLPAGLRSRALDAAAHGTAGKAAGAHAGAGVVRPRATHALRTVRNWGPRTIKGQVTAGVAAAAAVVVAVAIAVALHDTGHGQLAGGSNASPSAAASGPATAPSAGTGPGGANRPGGGPSSGPGQSGAATGGAGGSSGGASLTGHSGGSLPETGGSTGSGNPAPGGGSSSGAPQSTPGSSTPPASSGQPTPQASSPPPPAAGTLSVSAGTVLLAVPLLNSSITLTAHGGPVTWSIAQQSSLLGGISVSPASGTLPAGQSVRVAISANGLAGLVSTLIIHPGDRAVKVIVSVGL